MSGAVTFVSMPRSKPKTSAEGKEQLSSSLARMASTAGGGRGVPITEVGFGQCRFVIDDSSFPAVCCGEATLGGSWCAQHRALVFVRVAVQANGRRPAQPPVGANAGQAVQQPAQPPATAPGAKPAVAAPPAKALGTPPQPKPVFSAKPKATNGAAPQKGAAHTASAPAAKADTPSAAMTSKGRSTLAAAGAAGQTASAKNPAAKEPCSEDGQGRVRSTKCRARGEERGRRSGARGEQSRAGRQGAGSPRARNQGGRRHGPRREGASRQAAPCRGACGRAALSQEAGQGEGVAVDETQEARCETTVAGQEGGSVAQAHRREALRPVQEGDGRQQARDPNQSHLTQGRDVRLSCLSLEELARAKSRRTACVESARRRIGRRASPKSA